MQTNPYRNPQRRERIFNLAELRRANARLTAEFLAPESGASAELDKIEDDSQEAAASAV